MTESRIRDLSATRSLRPVAARAAAAVTPGPLEGCVDCRAQWQIEGCAIDRHHPDLQGTATAGRRCIHPTDAAAGVRLGRRAGAARRRRYEATDRLAAE